jgi:hypothetical protein
VQKRVGRIVRRLKSGAVASTLAAGLLFLAVPTAEHTAGAASAVPTVTSVSPSTGYGSDPPVVQPPTAVTILGTNFDGARGNECLLWRVSGGTFRGGLFI